MQKSPPGTYLERMRRLLRTLMAASALLAVAAAPDSFTIDELEALEAEKQAAQAELAALEAASDTVETDLATLETQLISAAMEARRREEQAVTAERRLIDLSTRLTSARIGLAADRVALEDLLGRLAVTGREPPPALIVSPDRANEAVRRAIVAGDAGPRLASRIEAVSEDVEAMNRLESKIRREKARLETAEAVLELKEAQILKLTTAKRAAFEDVSGDARLLRARVAELGERATSLRTLLAELEASAPVLPGRKPAIRPRLASASPDADTLRAAVRPGPARTDLKPLGAADLGRLARPVTGLVLRGFGDRMPGGGKSEGVTIQTRSRAQVLAPIDARIEYAGKFRSYGEMLILRTADGYHVILSGLSELYGSVGQTVKAGEPVGRMSARTDPAPELYLELRQGEASLNPARWMKRGR